LLHQARHPKLAKTSNYIPICRWFSKKIAIWNVLQSDINTIKYDKFNRRSIYWSRSLASHFRQLNEENDTFAHDFSSLCQETRLVFAWMVGLVSATWVLSGCFFSVSLTLAFTEDFAFPIHEAERLLKPFASFDFSVSLSLWGTLLVSYNLPRIERGSLLYVTRYHCNSIFATRLHAGTFRKASKKY